MLTVPGAGGLSERPSALEGRHALAWADGIWADTLARGRPTEECNRCPPDLPCCGAASPSPACWPLTGLLPALTRAWQASAFDADRVSDVLMALGGSARSRVRCCA